VRRGTAPLSLFLAIFGGLLMGSLFQFRLLPFLKSETILSGGKMVPTADFASSIARGFFAFSIFLLYLVGSVDARAVSEEGDGITMRDSGPNGSERVRSFAIG
jgi:hypothetical protein